MLQKLVIKKEENKYFCGITYLRINKNLELNDIINTIFFKDSDIDVIRGEKNEHPVFIAMFKYGEKNGK